MWNLANVAINPGEPVAEVMAGHRAEFIAGNVFADTAERDRALAEFDRIAAGLPALVDGLTSTFTFSLASE